MMKKVLMIIILMLICNTAKAYDYEKSIYFRMYDEYVIHNENNDFSYGTRNQDKKIYKKFKKLGYIQDVSFGKEIDDEDEDVLIVNIKGFKHTQYLDECVKRREQVIRIMKGVIQ